MAVVEICCGGYEDCINAWKGGADRLELNSALSVGGLTPTTALLRLVKKAVPLPVICMVRPRPAGFCYSEEETNVMRQEAGDLLEAGADGIAFGFLNADGTVNEERTRDMVGLIHSFGAEAVFHRAFDVAEMPFLTMETLISCGVNRVLTSGQRSGAAEGAGLLRVLTARYGNRMEILAGGGVNAENAPSLIARTGVSQVHASCREYRTDPTTGNSFVSYAYLPAPHERDREAVSVRKAEELVRAVRDL